MKHDHATHTLSLTRQYSHVYTMKMKLDNTYQSSVFTMPRVQQKAASLVCRLTKNRYETLQCLLHFCNYIFNENKGGKYQSCVLTMPRVQQKSCLTHWSLFLPKK